MLLTLALPAALEIGAEGIVRALYVAEGVALRPGAKLLDFSVDLSAGGAHDCPPISHYRIVLREAAWLRRLLVRGGDSIAAGQPIGLLTSEPDEPIDGMPLRAARIAVASILFHDPFGSAGLG